jgi:hypothetical protein
MGLVLILGAEIISGSLWADRGLVSKRCATSVGGMGLLCGLWPTVAPPCKHSSAKHGWAPTWQLQGVVLSKRVSGCM